VPGPSRQAVGVRQPASPQRRAVVRGVAIARPDQD
jgi:hypothetical protein